ncbi:hypothetical protein CA54_50600 [Symmachiella macrocystis]|uniref:Uncharacterized protein n=1 Tax=Symmachiella macrocystis TaxID=2527985 RepID=A0A5C6B3D8_9PLAN|nr:hypothetical protein CA54_50600 [Symmachiella macrocystis]
MSNPIRVECTHCSSTFRVKSAGAIGKTVDCPKCTGKFVIQKPRPKSKPKPKPKPAPELESDEDVFLADIDANRRARRKRRRSPQLEEGNHEPEEVPLALARPQLRRLKKKTNPAEELEDEEGWLSMGLGFPMWIIGGCLGSLVGLGLWALMGYLIPFPLGWMAVGMGFMVGLGVRLSAGENDGVGPGVTAAVITLFSIIIAKFITAMIIAAWLADLFVGVPADVEELSIQQIADEIVDERNDAGQDVDWPEKQPLQGMGQQQDVSSGYPPDIWAEAEMRWEEMPIEEQQARREEAENEQDRAEDGQEEFESAHVGDIFIFSFGLLDFIWIPIAVFTAFQLGANIADN